MSCSSFVLIVSNCFMTASLFGVLSALGAYELRSPKSFFGNLSPLVSPLNVPPSVPKHSLQYTGFPPVGRNGTSQGLLHFAQIALKSVNGALLPPLSPQFFLLKLDPPPRWLPNEGFPPLPPKPLLPPLLLYSVIWYGVCTVMGEIARGADFLKLKTCSRAGFLNAL